MKILPATSPSSSHLLKLEGSHLPKEGRSVGQCPKSKVNVLRAEVSSFSMLLNQHFQLNHHLEKQLQSGAWLRSLQAQRQLLSQQARPAGPRWRPGLLVQGWLQASARTLFWLTELFWNSNYSFRLHSELQSLAF